LEYAQEDIVDFNSPQAHELLTRFSVHDDDLDHGIQHHFQKPREMPARHIVVAQSQAPHGAHWQQKANTTHHDRIKDILEKGHEYFKHPDDDRDHFSDTAGESTTDHRGPRKD